MKRKNILGTISLFTILANITAYFIFNRPDVNITLAISVFVSFSVLGLIFAVLSKRIEFMIISIPLNLGITIVAIFLLFPVGLS